MIECYRCTTWPCTCHDGQTIIHGDCRAVLPQLEPVDLVFTSPPYGQQREYTIGDFSWDNLVPPAIASVPRHDTTQILVNLGLIHRDGEVVEYWDSLKLAMKREGLRLFGWYVWDQGDAIESNGHGRFGRSHEFIFHFNSEAVNLNKLIPCKSYGRSKRGSTGIRKANGEMSGERNENRTVGKWKFEDSVVRVYREMRRDYKHPAKFPEAFASRIVAQFPATTVLDPFLGSGTTLRACKDLGRKGIGIEIEERYCEIAANRLRQEVLF